MNQGTYPGEVSPGFYILAGNYTEGMTRAVKLAKAFTCVGSQEEGCPCRNCTDGDDITIITPGPTGIIKMSDTVEVLNLVEENSPQCRAVIMGRPESMNKASVGMLLKSIEDLSHWSRKLLLMVPMDLSAVPTPLVSRAQSMIVSIREESEWDKVRGKFSHTVSEQQWKDALSKALPLLADILNYRTKPAILKLSAFDKDATLQILEAMGHCLYEVAAMRIEIPNSVKATSRFDKIKSLSDLRIEDHIEPLLEILRKCLSLKPHLAPARAFADLTMYIAKNHKKDENK